MCCLELLPDAGKELSRSHQVLTHIVKDLMSGSCGLGLLCEKWPLQFSQDVFISLCNFDSFGLCLYTVTIQSPGKLLQTHN